MSSPKMYIVFFKMLPQFNICQNLFTFFLFMFLLFKTLKRYKSKNPTKKLPPGPWKLPIIGNIHQLIGSSLPHHSLRVLAKNYGPLMHLELGQVSNIVVSSPEMAKEVMKTHDIIFANRPFFLASRILSYDSTSIGFAPYGNYWRQLRKICVMELLSANRVQSFRSIREEEVLNLIKTIYSNRQSPINLSEKIFSLTYGITSRAAFGKKSKDQEAFISVITELDRVASSLSLPDMYPSMKMLQWITGLRPKLEKMHRETDRVLQNIVNEHKKRRKEGRTSNGKAEEDLVDVLLRVQEHGDLQFALSDNNIKAVILDIFIGGGETSSTTADWAMCEMFKNPRLMKEAQAEVRRVFGGKGNVDETGLKELKFLKLVIKETFRLHPPAPLLLPRESSESCEINGYKIPAKTKVLVNVCAIGRDARYWSEPDTFDPERFLDSSIDYMGTHFELIPFGGGRRMCPGISFAIPNIELPLAQLLYHFDWKLPNGMKHEDLDMTEAFGMTVRRKKDLFLIPIPYIDTSSPQ